MLNLKKVILKTSAWESSQLTDYNFVHRCHHYLTSLLFQDKLLFEPQIYKITLKTSKINIIWLLYTHLWATLIWLSDKF